MSFIDKLIDCIRVLFLGKSIDFVVNHTRNEVQNTVNSTLEDTSKKVDDTINNTSKLIEDNIEKVNSEVEDVVANSKKLGVNIRKK